MTPERYNRVRDIFIEACALEVPKRELFLDRACASDAELRSEVERLLRADADDASLVHSGHAARLVATALAVERPAGRPSGADQGAAFAQFDWENDPKPPERIGPYRVRRLIGQGGMGVVYEAEQINPRRTVALKVIRPGMASSRLVRRFQHEAQVLGQLQHPGIAQIYEAGMAAPRWPGQTVASQAREVPFFAMELVHGFALDVYVKRKELDAGQRLNLIARVCDAVQHAHAKGIIHRDLKPANILVDEFGNPKILDFGVAKLTESDVQVTTMHTDVGQIVGTLAYMSPEQIVARPDELDPRSDVYALGVVMFELLAERLPYNLRGCSLPEAARVIREDDPSHLSGIKTQFRGDIETIVAKALEKDRSRRYASAAELAADIRRYLSDQPIAARPASTFYQFRKFAKRNRGLVTGVIVAFAAMLLGTIFSIGFAIHAIRQRDVAQRLAYRTSLAATDAAMRDGDVAEARRRLDEAPQRLRGWEWSHLYASLDDSIQVIHSGPLIREQMAFAPDSRSLIYLVEEPGSGDTGRTFRIRATEAQTGRATSTRTLISPVEAVLSLCGTKVAYQATDGSLHVEDALSGENQAAVELPDGLRGGKQIPRPLCASAGGRMLLFGTGDRLSVFDTIADREHVLIEREWRDAAASILSRDGLLAACSDRSGRDGTLQVWETATGALVREFRDRVIPALPLAAGADHQYLLSANMDGQIRRWSMTEDPAGGCSQLLGGPDAILTMDISPDGGRFVTAGEDRSLQLWNARTGELLGSLKGHEQAIRRVIYAPDGRLLATSAYDGTIRIWDAAAVENPRVLRGHTSYIYPVAFSPNGRRIYSGSWDGTVRVWDADSSELIAVWPPRWGAEVMAPLTARQDSEGQAQSSPDQHDADGNAPPWFILDLAVSPDGTTVALSEGTRWLPPDNRAAACVRLIDARTGRTVGIVGEQERRWDCVLFHPRGDRLAAAGDLVTEWEVPSRKQIRSSEGFRHVAFSPDGSLMAVANREHRITLSRTEGGEVLHLLAGHEAPITRLAFSPDGRRLASSSKDHTARLWDAATGRPCGVLRGHTDTVHCVAWSPDGQRLATGSSDNTIRLWNMATLDEIPRLRGHDSYIYSLAFSPDGSMLISGSGDNTVRIWETRPLRDRIQARQEHPPAAAATR